MRLSNVWIRGVVFVGLTFQLSAEPVVIESSESGPQMLELFTSQGCSSCPPAERWIGRLVSDKSLWTSIVPVVFHVDYWDRLGWKDPFASERFTGRQYAYRSQGQSASVYTPGFFVGGKEWRGWFGGEPVPESSGAEDRFSLKAVWEQGRVEVESEAAGKLRVQIALLGFGLETEVKRGENRGRALSGDFVVIALHQGMQRKGDGRLWTTRFEPAEFSNEAKRYGLAVWIESGKSPAPICVIGGWLPEESLPGKS